MRQLKTLYYTSARLIVGARPGTFTNSVLVEAKMMPFEELLEITQLKFASKIIALPKHIRINQMFTSILRNNQWNLFRLFKKIGELAEIHGASAELQRSFGTKTFKQNVFLGTNYI